MEFKSFGELYAAITKVIPGAEINEVSGELVIATGLSERADGTIGPGSFKGEEVLDLLDEINSPLTYLSDNWDGYTNPGEDSVHYDSYLAAEEARVDRMIYESELEAEAESIPH